MAEMTEIPGFNLAYVLIFSLIVLGNTLATNMAGDNKELGWWRHAVFYQIYPRSFMDSNGDGIGDLRGVTTKLSYLAETGITATWLSPIFQSPMVDFGYDIADFKAIQQEYGSMADFDEMMMEAKRLGIKIILDFVPNHTSDKCDWFIKSVDRVAEYEDFYVWADGKMNAAGEREPPNNWQSVFYGSAWQWNDQRQQYYLHQFTVEQPDLNFRNPSVVAAMDEVLHFWLDRGVSGFRMDAVNHLYEVPDLKDEPLSGKTVDKLSYDYTEHIYTKNLPEVYDMLQHWRHLLDNYTHTYGGPERIMLTEAYAPLKLLMDYYESEAGVRGAQVPFNFFFITDLNAKSDARDFVYNIQKWLAYMPPGGGHVANWVMGNHDNPRVASRFGAERVDALNMLLMILPGVAVTYNGEEIGMQDYRDISWEDTVDPAALNIGFAAYKNYSRDPVRTPFQWDDTRNAGFSTAARTWLPVHPNYVSLNLAAQQQATKSHYKVYKELVALRNLPVLREGRFEAEVLTRQVFACKRTLRGQATLVFIMNLGAQEQQVSLAEFLDYPKQLKVLVASANSSYEQGHMLTTLEALALSPYEGLVAKLIEVR